MYAHMHIYIHFLSSYTISHISKKALLHKA